MQDFDDSRLSSRELEIITEMALGYSMAEVGQRLYIARNTVLSHKKNIYRKLRISKLIHVGVYAERKGLLDGKTLKL